MTIVIDRTIVATIELFGHLASSVGRDIAGDDAFESIPADHELAYSLI